MEDIEDSNGNQEDLEEVNAISVRQSIYNIKSKIITTVEDEIDAIGDDRQWNLPHLKKNFNTKEIKELFNIYIRRLNQAFFALLMLVQAGLFSIHFTVIVIFSQDLSSNALDLILYAIMTCISIKMFFVTDGCGYIALKETTLKIITMLFFVLLHIVNASVPLYYYFSTSHVQLRPAYTTHIVISCYVFFFISNVAITVFFGLITTIIHLLLLICITYNDLPTDLLMNRVFSDVIYLLCINGLGLYYRYLNEIIKRKSFLDRRACVIFNRHLQFQKMQEEHLMDAIIPSYVLKNIRSNFLHYWDQMENFKTNVTPFEYKNSFTQSFDNVTILYADVVNYTEMTVKLNITQLLETLNELFGNFDDVSERLKVLRIKFLGDCYYCVAGLPPEPPENHAEACVDLGLEMIRIIAEVRKRRNININMRIGVHTGKIISGIIGYQKIHFDIWSNDVSLANRMETEGVPGKVHLTQQTKDLLKKQYNIEPTTKNETVPQFKKYGITTYLITPDDQKSSIEKRVENAANKFLKKRTSNLPNAKRTSNSKAATRSSITAVVPKENDLRNSQIEEVVEDKVPEKKIQYYQLIESSYIEDERDSIDNSSPSPRRTGDNIRVSGRGSEKIEPRDSQRRTAFMNSNINRYKETMKETYKEMEEAIQTLYLTKYQQWFQFREINPLTLLFSKMNIELGFLNMPDPLFKYYLVSEVFLVTFLFIIQNLTLSSWNWESWWDFSTFGVIVCFFLPLMWADKFVSKNNSSRFLQYCASKSRTMTKSIWARLIIYTIVCTLFTLCVFSELINCRFRYSSQATPLEKPKNVLRSFITLLSTEKNNNGICIVPWHMTQTCALAIIMSFLFLRMIMWVKFTYAVLITSLYSWCVWNFADDILKEGREETYNYSICPKVSHILSVVFLTLTLHIIDRQTEYMNRLDFLWNEKLKEEQSKIQSRYIINKMLLNNVLPEHLTEMYLNVSRPPAALYHERYTNVAVMFASVVGYQVEDIGDDILLTIMAEIIGDFDKLILKSGFGHPIEKIKVAKWTYMAACGISPGEGEVRSEKNDSASCVNVTALLNFAACMIRQVSKLNREHQQDFKLRVGISNGEIVAGVVGSKKPLYDIWGDPVNMASRMDTTGEPNKIQVLEHTANLIKKGGYKCTLRGLTRVKGVKEPVSTYYVDLDDKFELVKMKN